MAEAAAPVAGGGAPLDALAARPHRRRNALTGEWVLVSPHRARRPWQGHIEPPAAAARPAIHPAIHDGAP